MKEFYTPEELAERFKLNRMTIYRLLRTGKIPSLRIGKSYRVPADRLEAWVTSRTKREENQPIISKVVEEFLRRIDQAPRTLREKIDRVILFGSYARGDSNKNSDIDVLVLEKGMTEEDEESLIEMLSDVKIHCEDDIALLTKTVQEWKRMREARSGLYRVIVEEGYCLWPTKTPMKSLIETGPSRP